MPHGEQLEHLRSWSQSAKDCPSLILSGDDTYFELWGLRKCEAFYSGSESISSCLVYALIAEQLPSPSLGHQSGTLPPTQNFEPRSLLAACSRVRPSEVYVSPQGGVVLHCFPLSRANFVLSETGRRLRPHGGVAG